MTLIKIVKKYFFLILFFIAALVYGYFNIMNNQAWLYKVKFFLVPSLLVHYLLTSKKKNTAYILALIFASVGDLMLSGVALTNEIIGVGCFICFNLLMIIIVSEKIGVVKGDKFLLAFVPLLIIIISVVYFLFNNYVGKIKTVIIIYFVIMALLTSFSLYYYLCRKTGESLLFFLAVLLLFLSNITKGYESFRTAGVVLKIINITFYALAHYLFYKSIDIQRVKRTI